ncbi:psm1 [Symbiodinium sp. CCMP2456]|nr:psm1 [Symbiodinium sp. CCMP2456]
MIKAATSRAIPTPSLRRYQQHKNAWRSVFAMHYETDAEVAKAQLMFPLKARSPKESCRCAKVSHRNGGLPDLNRTVLLVVLSGALACSAFDPPPISASSAAVAANSLDLVEDGVSMWEIAMTQSLESLSLIRLASKGNALTVLITVETAELLKLGKAHFKKLNSELGVDVREVLMREEREKQKLRSEIEQYEDHLRRVSAEATRAEQRYRSSHRLDQFKQDLQQYQRDRGLAEQRSVELQELQTQSAAKVQAADERVRKAKEQKEKFEDSNKLGRTDIYKLKVQADDAKKRLKRQNEKVKTIFSMICAIFRECRDRGIDLPLRHPDTSAMDKVLEREQEIDEMPLKDLENACRSVSVDFVNLPEDKKDPDSA